MALSLLMPPGVAAAENVPGADPSGTVLEGNARFQVLSPTLVRMEYSANQDFEDRPSFNAISRDLGHTKYTTSVKDGYRIIRTNRMTLRYRVGSGPFTTDNVSVSYALTGKKVTAHPHWNFAPLCHFGKRCEAEASELAGSTGRGGIYRTTVHKGYTGMGFLAGFKNAGDGATQTVLGVPESGTYKLTIRYANGNDSDRSLSVQVNGQPARPVQLPPTGDWARRGLASVDVGLDEGNNVVRIFRGEATGGLNIDNFAVTGTESAGYPAAEYELQRHVGGWRRAMDKGDNPKPLLPGLLNRDGWYLIDDTQTAVFDDGKVVSRPDHSGSAYQDGYLFAYGQDYKQALRDLRDLTGPAPLLPRAAFGVWFSRHDTYTEEEHRTIIQEFTDHEIPLEVLLVDTRFKAPSKWVGWSWDRELIADPKKFIDWAQDQGLTVLGNIHPGILADDPKFERAQEIAGGTLQPRSPGSNHYIFDLGEPEQARAYLWLHEQLRLGDEEFQWWYDSSGPRSSYSSKPGVTPDTWINSLYAERAKDRGLRPMVLSRGFSSIRARGNTPFFASGPWAEHRYSVHSTHDVSGNWDMLGFDSVFTQGLGSVGMPYEAHVVGGFLGDAGEDELYARWVQLGTFQPNLWLHSVHRAPRDKLPWHYGEEAERSASRFLRLREALLPYSYTLARIAHDTGVPMVRPMYLEYPEQEEAYQHPVQYMYGKDLLVAPVTEPSGDGVAETEVWFPPGTWIDYFTGERYQGPGKQTVAAPLDRMPVYVRAGGVLPMQPYQGVGQADPDAPLQLRVYAGDDGSTRVYRDAGKGLGYGQGQYSWRPVSHTEDADGRQVVAIGAADGHFPGQAESRPVSVQLVKATEPAVVLMDDRPLPRISAGGTEQGWWYDAASQTVHVNLASVGTRQAVSVAFEGTRST